MVYIHAVKYYTVIKRNTLLLYGTTQLNLLRYRVKSRPINTHTLHDFNYTKSYILQKCSKVQEVVPGVGVGRGTGD